MGAERIEAHKKTRLIAQTGSGYVSITSIPNHLAGAWK